jgi:FkbM family methyltransferase
MNSEVVNHKGFFWPIKDRGGSITSEYANPISTCYNLMYVFQNVPELISKFVKKHRVIIQAGGNAGFYVNLYSKIFEKVYTFEPLPLNFYCLNLNAPFENVFKYQACLGDTHECVDVFNAYESLGHGGSHVVGKGSVPTLMIDDLNLEICDLIHLDIEGYEKKALLGGIETIKRCKPVIVLEYFTDWLSRYATNITEIEEILHTLNYKYIDEVKGDRVYYPNDY